VAAEALLNGIPVIASDRGGLPETLNDGGFIVPLAAEIAPGTSLPPPAEAVRPWIELTTRLMTDAAFYQDAAHRAHKAGAIYSKEALVRTYCNYFESVLRTKGY
jgi:glycosyltransferase involved in cell wall biosynthesis